MKIQPKYNCHLTYEGAILDIYYANLVAGDWHEIEALEDGTVFINVFAESKQ